MAKESRRVRADEAMLAGLLHNIGKIYILARTPKDQADAFDEEDAAQLASEHRSGIDRELEAPERSWPPR